MKASAPLQRESAVNILQANATKATANPLQLKSSPERTAQTVYNPLATQSSIQNPLQRKENNTGLPDNLKAGVEALSGYSMDGVKVHYNSSKPAALQALAFAKGTDIHLAPGQEKHLPHEAWHVVQQMQGRVQPTMQMKGEQVNDDDGLEKEADRMGGRAMANILPLQAFDVDRAVASKAKDVKTNNRLNGFNEPKPNIATNDVKTGQSVTQCRKAEKSSSADILEDLAVPKVFEGPEVEIQKDIVAALEKEIEKSLSSMDEVKRFAWSDIYNLTFIGAIELQMPEAKLTNFDDLVEGVKLIKLGSIFENKLKHHSLKTNENTFDLVEKAGLQKKIIRNTLATMKKAGQLKYLLKSGLINNEDWKVLIEIHYYRNRSPKDDGFHRDTRGQTLFVNLNYLNDEEIAGAEYVVNPMTNPNYEDYISKNLPPIFINDLNKFKQKFGAPGAISASRIPPNGVLSFVDEAIFHKTPNVKHRTVSAKLITTYYPTIVKSYKKHRLSRKKFEKNLKLPYKLDAPGWAEIISSSEGENVLYDRNKLKLLLPNLPHKELEVLIKIGDNEQFKMASITNYTEKLPVKAPGRPPLKRQMSTELLQGTAPEPLVGKRSFFRTWVRAVPVNQTTPGAANNKS